MAKLTLSRRSFIKAAAVTGAAAAISTSAAPLAALAETENTSSGEIERIRSCCRACGKSECGVWITVQNGKVIKIEGDESNAHSRGHCCAKSQASLQAVYHPDRLKYAMKRTNPKGSDDPGWVRVSLEEAFTECGTKFKEIVAKYGGYSNFSMGGTSRVWAQPPYGTLKGVFPTPNAHLAYEICKGPRHFGGILTDEIGSPWMEVEQGPSVYVQWGTASEYSNYDSTNRTVSDVAARAKAHILVDPRISPLGKEADVWLPLRVGTDGAMANGWLKWIMDNEAYDDAFVKRWTNAPFLVVDDKVPSGGWVIEMNGGIDMKTRLLTEADMVAGGSYKRFMVWDSANERLTYWDSEECQWENELHKIPTTGMWIEHPYKPLVADAWLPDISTFADPATEPDRFVGNAAGSNPKGARKDPSLFPGEFEVTFADGSVHKVRSVWDKFDEFLDDYTLEKVEAITGVSAAKIDEAVRAYTTRVDPRYGNGGIHYQLAPDQTGNAVQNTRSLQLIACLTGNSDEPAGNRGSSKSMVDGCAGRADMRKVNFGDKAKTWNGRDKSIEDLVPEIQAFVQYLIDENSPLAARYKNTVPTHDEAYFIAERMGGAYKKSTAWPNPVTSFERNGIQVDAERFPLLRYWSRWTDAAAVWDSINPEASYHEVDPPYQLHGGICMSGDMMNQANAVEAWNALKKLDFFVDINLWSCPNNGCADIVFPTMHWLEVNTTRVSQGAGGVFGAGTRAIQPQGDCLFDPVFVVLFYKCMGVPFNQKDPEYDEWLNLSYDFIEKGGSYEDMEARVLKDACDAWHTKEFPAGLDFSSYQEMFKKEGWFDCRTYHPERWGTYRRWEMGYRRQQGGYNLYPLVDGKAAFFTPTAKIEVWSTIIESYVDAEDIFPRFVEPKNSIVVAPDLYAEENCFTMTTGSRQPVYFHSEHRQLPWCRELWPAPRLEMNPNDAALLGLEQGDWVWIESEFGKVRQVIDLYYGISKGVVNANHGWWYPEIDSASHGFELVNINTIMDKYAQCHICGASQLRGLPVKVYKATAENSPFGNPIPCDPNGVPVIQDASDPRLKEWLPGAAGLQTARSLIKEEV